jgi:hypothetical protein
VNTGRSEPGHQSWLLSHRRLKTWRQIESWRVKRRHWCLLGLNHYWLPLSEKPDHHP